MTLLLSWVGKDSRKISSFYIASDSRFSWGNPIQYDYGRKVFAFKNSPDILGYCGDVLYPITIIHQMLNMDSDNLLFPPNSTKEERSKIIYDELTNKFEEYPSKHVMRDQLEIIHASRDNATDFLCKVYEWSKTNGWKIKEYEIPDLSEKVLVLGSGSKEFLEKYQKYKSGLNAKTSRALFQCLCGSLKNIKDKECGGAPQLVGLYNKFNGKNFGILFDEDRYYLGKQISNNRLLHNLEWRNELFERCDGVSKKILRGAQRQPNEFL